MSARKLFTWKIKDREIRLGERTLIVAVLNITPDSFSDGGRYEDPDRAYARALELEEQGADILDIGAESTRPGSARISAAEEIRRLIPVLKRLKGALSIPISVDTYKAEVATLALEHGAEIINDPSGFTFDPLLAKAVVESNAGLILNHMRGTPETWEKLPPLPDVMGIIIKDLDASTNRARRSGVDRNRIVVDPGLGFGKRKEQNSQILARLPELAKLEFPILTGPSRKSFLAHATERETLYASAGAVAASVWGGAHMVRVHDVLEMKAVLAVADEVLRSLPEPGEDAQHTRAIAAPKSAAPRKPSVSPSNEYTAERSKPTRPPLLAKRLPPAEEAPRPIPPQTEDRRSQERDSEERRPPRRFSAADDGKERSFPPKRFNRPAEGSDRPYPPKRFGAPREGGDRPYPPKRSGPPREAGDRPYPPKRFSAPREGGDRPYPPKRSGPPREGGDRPYPPKRFGAPREGGDRPYPPKRSGPPRDGGDRPYPPKRSGPPREGGDRPFSPKRSGDRFSGPPRKSGPPRGEFGPRKSGPHKKGGGGPPRRPKGF